MIICNHTIDNLNNDFLSHIDIHMGEHNDAAELIFVGFNTCVSATAELSIGTLEQLRNAIDKILREAASHMTERP